MVVICSACSTSLNDAGSRRNLEGESSTEVRCKIKELLCRNRECHFQHVSHERHVILINYFISVGWSAQICAEPNFVNSSFPRRSLLIERLRPRD